MSSLNRWNWAQNRSTSTRTLVC